MSTDMEHLQQWIGRTETLTDRIGVTPVAAMAATLDRGDLSLQTGAEVPALWHWLYFLPTHKQSELGPDGHAKRGGFLPPVPLPRRMWAGGSFEFHAPLRIGDEVTRTSRIADVKNKQGRSGPLVFVQVSHEIHNQHGPVLTERQDLVYRDAAPPGATRPAPQAPTEPGEWSREIVPDPVLLFRYSALTFNGHRIHYDHPYTTQVEGYPGLVVHGPLIATLLLDLLRRHSAAKLTGFSFRAVSPLFDTAAFRVCGTSEPESGAVRLWALNDQGGLAMEATAQLKAHS